MTEPAVTLTDFGLFLECGIFAALLLRCGSRPLARWFALFFASIGIAAFCGGLVHGFFLDETTQANAILWRVTMTAIGVTAFSAWGIAVRLPPRLSAGGQMWGRAVVKAVTVLAAVTLLVYEVVVLGVNQDFSVAILHYLPPMLFLLVVLFLQVWKDGRRASLYGLCGVVLTFAASGIQQAGISIHPVYFDHNALYHLIEAIALFLIFLYAYRMRVQSDCD